MRPRLPEGLLLPFATSAASAEESEQLSGETGARSVYKLIAPVARVSRIRALLSKTPLWVSIHSEPRTGTIQRKPPITCRSPKRYIAAAAVVAVAAAA